MTKSPKHSVIPSYTTAAQFIASAKSQILTKLFKQCCFKFWNDFSLFLQKKSH